MPTAKIAISMDDQLLKKVDLLVREKRYPNRSNVIQEAVREKLMRMDKTRLAAECAKLDAPSEQAMADEGFAREIDAWPEY